MSTAAKIATCSYCETRVVIPLSGDSRHELVCSSCGAPLQNTKLIHKNPAPAAAAQTLFKAPEKKSKEEKPTKDKQRDEKRDVKKREEKYRRKRRDSEEYKKRRKYKSRDSEDRKWSKEDDDLAKKYKKRKYHERKKSNRKRRGLVYWIREIIDEITDFFD